MEAAEGVFANSEDEVMKQHLESVQKMWVEQMQTMQKFIDENTQHLPLLRALGERLAKPRIHHS